MLAPTAFGTGTVGASVLANFEKRLVGMTLPGNWMPVSGSTIGVARPEKLPDSSVWVGTAARNGSPFVVLKPSYDPNTNALLCLIGPPLVTLNWLRFSSGLVTAKKFFLSN